MKSVNSTTRQLTEAIHFIITEARVLALTGMNEDILKPFLEDFSAKQAGLRGQALFVRSRYEATAFAVTLVGREALTPFSQLWLSYLLSRALLITVGCYTPASAERHWHWQHYKPLLALLKKCKPLNMQATSLSDYTSIEAFSTPVLVLVLN